VADGVGSRTDEIRKFILANLDSHPRDLVAVTRANFQVSRQAISLHLKSLEGQGLLVSEGNTRRTVYRRPERLIELPILGLSEHAAYQEHVRPVLTGLPENIQMICEHGVTEIVNNAIDHSASNTVRIQTKRTRDLIDISIMDTGIGIFRKIHQECQLEDVRHAIFELTKGKLTTDPKHHTGEGIFFTSRMFDVFSILSYGLYLGHRRDGSDWLLHNPEEDKEVHEYGTSVFLKISPQSTHTSAEVFQKYAAEQDDYAFNKTHVIVELSKTGEETFTSRSQAKRIVTRLEKFKEVVLDFSDVQEIGPAFADQIFRVFASQYPETHLIPINANEQVTKMIQRALSHDSSGVDVT